MKILSEPKAMFNIATLLAHLPATGWAGFQMLNTTQFHSDFAELATDGTCHPINLLSTYWQSRVSAVIPGFVLNAVALLVSTFLSWKLVQVRFPPLFLEVTMDSYQ